MPAMIGIRSLIHLRIPCPMTLDTTSERRSFFGWRVVGAAFLVATLSWGSGFYGPSVFLYAIEETRGWSVGLVSAAVTAHFLFGSALVANLPALHRRFGLPLVTAVGAGCLSVGVFGWSLAAEPWQLFAVTAISGAGWGTTSGAAINGMIAPWFHRRRPAALSLAYNGASIGGVIFQSLWIAAIGFWGFPAASLLIGVGTIGLIAAVSILYFTKSPASVGQAPDGDAPSEANTIPPEIWRSLPGPSLWGNWRFLTLCVGTGICLFGQIGLLAHMISIYVPTLGAQWAGFCASAATASAISGRTLVAALLPPKASRRAVIAANSGVQIVGLIAFALAGGENLFLIGLGAIFFGFGIGNSTSLPPLIAQTDFTRADVPRVVALNTAVSQACYAFAPAAFGLFRTHLEEQGPTAHQPVFFLTVAAVLALSAIIFLIGRQKPDASL